MDGRPDANRLPERPWLVPGVAIGGGDMDVIPGMVGASRLAIRGAGLVSCPHAGKDALERGLTAMDEDDLEPRREAPKQRNLEPMSIEELKAYIAELEAEIARVQAHLESKEKYRGGIETLFKK